MFFKIIEKAKKNLEIHIAAPNIDNESYWKDACELKKDTWKLTRLEQHGMSWKNAFCEKNLVQFLMKSHGIDLHGKEKVLFNMQRIFYI